MVKLEQIIIETINHAHQLHDLVVMDEYKDQEVSEETIGEFFRYNGWQFFLDQHNGGTYAESTFSGTTPEWCGLFVAYCFQGTIGPDHQPFELHPDIRKYVMPSTARLASAAKWNQAGFMPFDKVDVPEPGDIVVVGDRKEYGDHITLCIDDFSGNGKFTTIEGNAHGELGNGEYGEGVVVRSRPLSAATHIYRPRLEHFLLG